MFVLLSSVLVELGDEARRDYLHQCSYLLRLRVSLFIFLIFPYLTK